MSARSSITFCGKPRDGVPRRAHAVGEIGLFFGLTDIGRYQTCPPILTLVARQLFLGDSTRFLSGRFVFVEHVFSD